MIAEAFGLRCSKSCEQLIAFACLKAPEIAMSIARQVENDGASSAIALMTHLLRLPRTEALRLCQQTLAPLHVEADRKAIPR